MAQSARFFMTNFTKNTLILKIHRAKLITTTPKNDRRQNTDAMSGQTSDRKDNNNYRQWLERLKQ